MPPEAALPTLATRSGQAMKKAAAARALQEVQSGMRLGLGTGSTVASFLELLGAALAEGRIQGIVGVPTSRWTEGRCRELGIPLTDLAEAPELDLTVDGADEVDPELELVKGLGGALLREKVVAQASRRFLVMVDSGKQVQRLGTRSPLPVEVVPFGWTVHMSPFRALGAEPTLRRDEGGEPVVTDNGNYLVDLHFPSGISDPPGVQEALRRRAGVVETGLFLGMAHAVAVAGSHGVELLTRREG